jgi:hypothetical protein
MVVPLSSISAIEQGEWERSTQPEALMFGRGKQYNIKLAFSKPQYYYSNMGQAKENAEFVYLNINDSALLVSFIEQQKSSQNMPS